MNSATVKRLNFGRCDPVKVWTPRTNYVDTAKPVTTEELRRRIYAAGRRGQREGREGRDGDSEGK